jgi:TetR/AcrR family transcriptional repressor of nem operon
MPRTTTREKLLSTGYRLLLRRGFNATSVQDITEAARVPKGSFYNHFDSKESLAAEAVRCYMDDLASRGSVDDAALPPLEKLRKHFEDLAGVADKDRLVGGCLLGNFSAELSNQSEVVRQRVADAFDGWAQSLATDVASAQRAGTVSKELSPDELAASLVDAWQGALLRAKAQKDRAPLDRFLSVTFPKILT